MNETAYKGFRLDEMEYQYNPRVSVPEYPELAKMRAAQARKVRDSAKSWLNVTRAQMLAAHRPVLLITENCAGGAWDGLFHQKNDGNWTQGTQSSFEGFAYPDCRLPDDARFMDGRGKKFTRIVLRFGL